MKEHVHPFQMDIMLPSAEDGKPSVDVVPLFKLVHGTGRGSFGFACALASGVPENIVARARHVAGAIKKGDQISPIFDNGKVCETIFDH